MDSLADAPTFPALSGLEMVLHLKVYTTGPLHDCLRTTKVKATFDEKSHTSSKCTPAYLFSRQNNSGVTLSDQKYVGFTLFL